MFNPPLWKRGVKGDFIHFPLTQPSPFGEGLSLQLKLFIFIQIHTRYYVSMIYCNYSVEHDAPWAKKQEPKALSAQNE